MEYVNLILKDYITSMLEPISEYNGVTCEKNLKCDAKDGCVEINYVESVNTKEIDYFQTYQLNR